MEKPDSKFIDKEDGQVTRMAYPNDKKIGSKLKTGDRVWLYYVSEEVILESKLLKDKKDKVGQERIDKIKKAAYHMKKDILDGTVGNAEKIAKIHNPFKKKK